VSLPQTPPRPDAPSRPRLWAVGGGKGGAGKSVVSTNLGVTLARRGRRSVLVDADLGGANLHTLLGTRSPKRTLSDFLLRKVPRLDDVLTPTSVPDLWLASGSQSLVEMANPKYAQKEKLLRHVTELEVDHVILDLGAGSSFNVLDFFLAADAGILVVVPEPTSVENAYHFLKAAFFRRLKRATHLPGVRGVLDQVLSGKDAGALQSARALLTAVRRIDPEVADTLVEEAGRFTPHILVNRARTEADRGLGADMQTACQDYFGAEVGYLGALAYDDLVRTSVQARRPVVEAFPTSAFAGAIDGVAGRLLALEDAAADASYDAPPPAQGSRQAAASPIVGGGGNEHG
jgi:flagellar biosynthesis protein FlhG